MASHSVAPLKVDAETDALITQGASFLGVTKKELVAEAVRTYLATRRADLERSVREVMTQLDGSREAEVSVLSGLSVEEINQLGGL